VAAGDKGLAPAGAGGAPGGRADGPAPAGPAGAPSGLAAGAGTPGTKGRGGKLIFTVSLRGADSAETDGNRLSGGGGGVGPPDPGVGGGGGGVGMLSAIN
jgi:hypothetical protein